MSNAAVTHLKQSLRSLQGWLEFARTQWISSREHAPVVTAVSTGRAALATVVPIAEEETLGLGASPPSTLPPDVWRQISPAATADVRQQVLAQPLSTTLRQWIADYKGFGPRDLYLWRWCALGVRLTMLPCVEDAWREDACDTKVLSIMLNVLVDDVADRRQRSRLLPPLLSVVRGAEPCTQGLSEDERAHVHFTRRVWREYWNRVQRYPCAAVFRELLEYDLDQLFNAIHYSALLNQQLGLLNVVEHDLYSPHNMMMMSFATLDLMCAPSFHAQELGKLREAVWHAQWMGRIGNLLSTWEREIGVGDFTSGVFAQAISRGDLTVEDLEGGDRRRIRQIIDNGGYHADYCRRWRYHRDCFHQRAEEIHSVDMQPLLAGHDRFFRLHLGSRGLI